MDKELSSLLQRQLKRSKIDLDSETIPTAIFRDFLTRIDASYEDFKERESRYEQVCRQSSDEIANYLEKLKQAEAINKQQQADILNMLRNIKQGIFTINEHRCIHPEFSVHTTAILERTDIAGRDVAEILFEKALLDRDTIDQVLATLGAILGADDLAFEANNHILPEQIYMSFDEGREKALEVDWTPIFDESGRIEKILVTIRDVSDLRELQRINYDQQKELDILGQLIRTNPSRFQQFYRSSCDAIAQSTAILEREGRNISLSSLQELYRDLHTIKGNARMYGFRSLTNIVHEAEEAYKVSLHAIHGSWDPQARIKDLSHLREELNYYKEMADRAFSASETTEQKHCNQFTQDTLTVLQQLEQQKIRPEEALATIRDSAKIFAFAPLGQILENVVQGIPSLAIELAKTPPLCQVEDHAIGFHSQAHAALEGMFNHLIRNTLDHGIELDDQRVSKGKSRRGRIAMTVEAGEGEVMIRYEDDGQGLDLEKIRAKAREKGLLQAGMEHDAERLSQLIFEPGFSTKQQVNEISGRGMGMPAVRSLIESLGGSVNVSLGTGDDRFRPLSFRFYLPLHLVSDLNAPLKPTLRRIS